MIKKLLIAFDGSDAARKAFHFAVDLAARFEASLLVLSVVQVPEPAAMVEATATLELAVEHYKKDFVDLYVAAETVGVAIECRVAVGHVAEQIVHYASEEHADLIVMGHRGKSLIQRWLLGSVSNRVISYAHCSVLVVR